MNKSDVKLLICDDSILARKSLDSQLRALGFEKIIEVANGQDAVERYASERPDIVFLDIIMPLKDGITATKEIMEIDSSANIIMASSVGTQSHLREAIKAGAIDFIQKPIEAGLLEQILNQCLTRIMERN